MTLVQRATIVLLVIVVGLSSIALFTHNFVDVNLLDYETQPVLVDGSGNPGACC